MNVERKNAKDDLRLYMPEVIGMLKREGKFPAMHVYACTLRSYEKFCAEERYPKNTTASLSMQEIFTPERLKEYEDWLAGQQRGTIRCCSRMFIRKWSRVPRGR